MKNETGIAKKPTLDRAVRRPPFSFSGSSGIAATLCLLLAASCSTPRPLRGGRALTTHQLAGLQQTLVQGENPSQATSQAQETVKVRTYTLPPGSRIEEARVQSAVAGVAVTNLQAVVVSAPMPVVEREETRAHTELGAAQKDTARELGAKLSSLKGIMWVGLGLFLFGLASLVWPPLKVIIGSVTTSAAIILGGLALLVLPTLLVGNELLILGGVTLTAGAWFLAHRHGQLRGVLSATTPSSTPIADSPPATRNTAPTNQSSPL